MRSTLNQTLFLPLGVNDVRGQRCPIKGTHLSEGLVGYCATSLMPVCGRAKALALHMFLFLGHQETRRNGRTFRLRLGYVP